MLVSRFVEKFLAVLLDLLFMFLIDFCRVLDAARFEIRIGKLVCDLSMILAELGFAK
jgi:hypothetical protein